MEYYAPSREMREYAALARAAVGTPPAPTHDLAKELTELLDDQDALATGHDELQSVLERRDLEEEGTGTHSRCATLLDILAAAREHLEPYGFNLVTGEAECDQDTPSGPSRLQRFLAAHDDLVRFRARVAKVLEDCGALAGPVDDDRMVNLLRMLMPQ